MKYIATSNFHVGTDSGLTKEKRGFKIGDEIPALNEGVISHLLKENLIGKAEKISKPKKEKKIEKVEKPIVE